MFGGDCHDLDRSNTVNKLDETKKKKKDNNPEGQQPRRKTTQKRQQPRKGITTQPNPGSTWGKGNMSTGRRDIYPIVAKIAFVSAVSVEWLCGSRYRCTARLLT